MADVLKTDYVNDVLDTDVNTERTYNIVDSQGNIIYANARIRETTVFTTEGEPYGAPEINEQNTFINGLKSTFSQTLADLKATAIAQAVGVTVSDTFAQVITKLGAIINRGKVTKTLSGGETYTIPEGYHNGQGTVSAPAQTGTYKPTQRKNNNDMGAKNTYRYVDTTAVPNSNSQTYSVTSNGTKDMGETNNYRYVDVAVNQTPSFYQKSPTTKVTYTADNGYSSVTAFADIDAPQVTISKNGNVISVVIDEAITMRGAMGGNKGYTRTIGVNMTI